MTFTVSERILAIVQNAGPNLPCHRARLMRDGCPACSAAFGAGDCIVPATADGELRPGVFAGSFMALSLIGERSSHIEMYPL
jgi:hypothetical protein